MAEAKKRREAYAVRLNLTVYVRLPTPITSLPEEVMSVLKDPDATMEYLVEGLRRRKALSPTTTFGDLKESFAVVDKWSATIAYPVREKKDGEPLAARTHARRSAAARKRAGR